MVEGQFWCGQCRESFPDSIQEQHQVSHAAEASDSGPDAWAIYTAIIMVAVAVIAGLVLVSM